MRKTDQKVFVVFHAFVYLEAWRLKQSDQLRSSYDIEISPKMPASCPLMRHWDLDWGCLVHLTPILFMFSHKLGGKFQMKTSSLSEHQKDKICLHWRNKGSVSCCIWLILARSAGSQMGWAQMIQHEGLRARPFYRSQQNPVRLCCLMARTQRRIMCLACINGGLTSMTLHWICASYSIYRLEEQCNMFIRVTCYITDCWTMLIRYYIGTYSLD